MGSGWSGIGGTQGSELGFNVRRHFDHTMQISENSIDLIKTEEAFGKRYRAKPLSRVRFGREIVHVAHGAIGRHGVSPELLPGIQRCLIEMAGRLNWRSHIWFIPIPPIHEPFKRGPFGGFCNSEELQLLVDSLLMTILSYRDSLWEFETDLAQILLTDLILGFERVCDWIERGVSIDKEKNDLIVQIGPEWVSKIEDMVSPRRAK